MPDAVMTGRPSLEMRWVPVTDELGATRVRAVWIDVTSATSDTSASAPEPTHHAA